MISLWIMYIWGTKNRSNWTKDWIKYMRKLFNKWHRTSWPFSYYQLCVLYLTALVLNIDSLYGLTCYLLTLYEIFSLLELKIIVNFISFWKFNEGWDLKKRNVNTSFYLLRHKVFNIQTQYTTTAFLKV